MKNKGVKALTVSALVAALYVALTYVSFALGLSSGAIQFRLSEVLCVLVYFTPYATYGLSVGCFLANLLTGCAPLDIIFGTLATFLGAFVGSKMKNKYLVPLPTVISNALIVPFVIMYCYSNEANPFVYFSNLVGVVIGETAMAYVLGLLLLKALEKNNAFKNLK
ncbi:MAG: QueT transporter family protein [Clostridia bacterium]|nr:QueT transporter family protein [Clostridia bacterium]